MSEYRVTVSRYIDENGTKEQVEQFLLAYSPTEWYVSKRAKELGLGEMIQLHYPKPGTHEYQHGSVTVEKGRNF